MDVQATLGTWAGEVGLDVEADVWTRLGSLADLWARYGAAFNLVGDTSEAALAEHLREGLMAVEVAKRSGFSTGAWLDIGSGAGIPGLVVGVVRDDVVLVEPRERRAAFLELAISALEVARGTVIRARIAGKTWRNVSGPGLDEREKAGIRICSAKAVMPVEQWVRTGSELLPSGLTMCHTTAERVATLPFTALARVDHGDRAVVGGIHDPKPE